MCIRDRLSTVERYDPDKNIWEFRASLSCARSALSLAAIDEKLYAMGLYLNINSI